MPHDAHFLSRLERVTPAQVELALTLYRDPALVGFVLGRVRLPDAADRVAFATDAAPGGPHVVVTRDGHFVTCLGPGMSPTGLPVVTRGQLDGVAAKHEELRARMALAETLTGGKGETRRLLDRIGEAGDELSREELVALTAWSPIMAMSFLREMLRVHVKIDAALPRLLRMERARPRDIEHLRTFWRSSWAMGHLLLLAAVDDRTLLDGMPQGALEQLAGISTPLVRLGSSYLAVRAAWAIGRLGKPLLAQAKRRLGEATRACGPRCARRSGAPRRIPPTLRAPPPSPGTVGSWWASWITRSPAPRRPAPTSSTGRARTTWPARPGCPPALPTSSSGPRTSRSRWPSRSP
jgi:hypothetical protein